MIHGASKVWYRDFVVWTRYWWTSLIGATAEPVLYFLAMGYGLGSFVRDIDGIPYIQFLAPALICSAVMHSASFETTYSSFTRMEIQKTYHSIATTPVNWLASEPTSVAWERRSSSSPKAVMLMPMSRTDCARFCAVTTISSDIGASAASCAHAGAPTMKATPLSKTVEYFII